MNSNEYVQAHAEQAKATTASWHKHTAPTAEAQARARGAEQQAKSDALQRSAEYRRDLPVDG